MTRMLHRDLTGSPLIAESADGLLIRSADGREVIDGSGGAAVACLGHGHPRVVAAIREQAGRLCYAHTSFYTTGPAEALAERLVGHAPGGLTHAYFVSSGSEAMEAALKLARQYMLETGQPQRDHFIARRQSYHGNTLGALAASGNMAPARLRADALARASATCRPASPIAGRCRARATPATWPAWPPSWRRSSTHRARPRRRLPRRAVVGATLGCVTAVPGYFQAMRAVCDRHGALLILDEVMCGMGRTGTLHAWEQEGVVPDIQAVAKGLGGGYQPIGGILLQGRIVAALRAGSGRTATATPTPPTRSPAPPRWRCRT